MGVTDTDILTRVELESLQKPATFAVDTRMVVRYYDCRDTPTTAGLCDTVVPSS